VLVSSISHAEDIEIYSRVFSSSGGVGSSPTELNPNILFVLDTSGSMNELVPIPASSTTGTGVYDSTVDYGNDGNAADDDLIYVYNQNLVFENVTVTPSQNACQAYRDNLASNPNNPVFLDNIEQWRRVGRLLDGRDIYGWRGASIDQLSGTNNVIECEDDSGIHGLTQASSNRYARNGDNNLNAALSSNPLYRFNAGSRRNPFDVAHHLVPGNYHDYLQSLPSAVAPGTDLFDACLRVQPDGSVREEGDRVTLGGLEYVCRQRLAVMQEALSNSVSNLDDVNIGLMRFNQNTLPLGPCTAGFNTPFGFVCSERGPRTTTSTGTDGGTIIRSVDNINEPIVRENFLSDLGDLTPSGNTPLTEAFYEAYRYFTGQSRDFGNPTNDGNAPTDSNALEGGVYKSPIISECQDNNIVLLSDGFPTADQFADDRISSLVAGTCNFDESTTDNDDFEGSGGSCLDDLASHMANTDLISDDKVIGTNPVFTYTIGFTEDIPLLQNTAEAARRPGSTGPVYFQANDLVGLEAAFRTVVANIQTVDADTFVAPAVTVNAFNRLQNRDDLYFLVFNPSDTPRWNGNLKRYFVEPEFGGIENNPEIVDSNGIEAVNDDTGFFVDEAQSFWSDQADGAVVEDGGAAEQITTNRTLFANLDSSTNDVVSLTDNAGLGGADESVEVFLELTELLDIGEVGVTPEQIAENRADIARWTIGTDIDNERQLGNTGTNNYIGETLHGTPFVLSFGTTIDDPQDVIFFTTNQGVLHAIAAQETNGLPEGSELWGYIPDPELLENLGGYYNRSGLDHIYGLDATIAFDVQRNLDTNLVEHAFLYFGQRRGGNKYFAVDATNAQATSNPVSKLFTIEGGVGDFEKMGQTWATPITTKIRYCESGQINEADCELRDVLIISGGYDVAYDDASIDIDSLAGDVNGNVVYIVDAKVPDDGDEDTRGQVLWTVSNEAIESQRDLVIPEMLHSIPSTPSAIDVDGDGAVDVMFIIDVAGQVFRVDFDFGNLDSNGSGINVSDNRTSVAGGLIADLSENSVNRRFYNTLDATILSAVFDGDNVVADARFALVTGSGYRAHPIAPEPFDNRFYVLFDYNLSVPEAIGGEPNYLYAETSISGVQQFELIDMDTSTALEIVDEANPIDLANEHQNGYFISLGLTGEKALSSTTITESNILATTYIPEEVPAGTGAVTGSASCSGGIGNSRAVVIDAVTGEPTFFDLENPGLSPQPVVVRLLVVDDSGNESLKPIIVIGTEILEEFDGNGSPLQGPNNIGKATKKAWWEVNRGTGN